MKYILTLAALALLLSNCAGKAPKQAIQSTATAGASAPTRTPTPNPFDSTPEDINGEMIASGHTATGIIGTDNRLIGAAPAGGAHSLNAVAIFVLKNGKPKLVPPYIDRGVDEEVLNVAIKSKVLRITYGHEDVNGIPKVSATVMYQMIRGRIVALNHPPLPPSPPPPTWVYSARPLRSMANAFDPILRTVNDRYSGKVFTDVTIKMEDGAPNVYFVVDQSSWDGIPESTRKTMVKPGGVLFDQTVRLWRKYHFGKVCLVDKDHFLMLHVVNAYHVEVGLDYTVFVARSECGA